MKYRIFIQPNSVEYVQLFLHGYGWILLTTVTIIMLFTLQRSCLRRRACRRRDEEDATLQELSELNVTLWNDEESTEICSICMEHFLQNEEVRILPCEHIFHK